jgi:hypothetical protein
MRAGAVLPQFAILLDTIGKIGYAFHKNCCKKVQMSQIHKPAKINIFIIQANDIKGTFRP